MKIPVPVCDEFHNVNCQVSDAERMTAKVIGIKAEDMHNIMDWHMVSLNEIAKSRRRDLLNKVYPDG